jgi:hypothetical protein
MTSAITILDTSSSRLGSAALNDMRQDLLAQERRMFLSPFRITKTGALAIAAAVGFALLPAHAAHAAGAFSALKGSWSGSGVARFASGESERLRCSARYSGGSTNLSLHLKCASPSAQINLSGNLDAHGRIVVGDWSESSFGLSGSARGSTSGGTVRLKISGSASGYLTLSVAGRRHSVAVSTQGTSLTGVNVSMRRR